MADSSPLAIPERCTAIAASTGKRCRKSVQGRPDGLCPQHRPSSPSVPRSRQPGHRLEASPTGADVGRAGQAATSTSPVSRALIDLTDRPTAALPRPDKRDVQPARGRAGQAATSTSPAGSAHTDCPTPALPQPDKRDVQPARRCASSSSKSTRLAQQEEVMQKEVRNFLTPTSTESTTAIAKSSGHAGKVAKQMLEKNIRSEISVPVGWPVFRGCPYATLQDPFLEESGSADGRMLKAKHRCKEGCEQCRMDWQDLLPSFRLRLSSQPHTETLFSPAIHGEEQCMARNSAQDPETQPSKRRKLGHWFGLSSQSSSQSRIATLFSAANHEDEQCMARDSAHDPETQPSKKRKLGDWLGVGSQSSREALSSHDMHADEHPQRINSVQDPESQPSHKRSFGSWLLFGSHSQAETLPSHDGHQSSMQAQDAESRPSKVRKLFGSLFGL